MTRPSNARKRSAAARRPRPRPGSRRTDVADAPVEGRTLELAREVAAIARSPATPRDRLTRALERLAAAFGSEPDVAAQWLEISRRARADADLNLSLAWAREQLRASLEEILTAGIADGVMRKRPDAPAMAWVLLAACEGLLREAPGGGVVSTPDLLPALVILAEP